MFTHCPQLGPETGGFPEANHAFGDECPFSKPPHPPVILGCGGSNAPSSPHQTPPPPPRSPRPSIMRGMITMGQLHGARAVRKGPAAMCHCAAGVESARSSLVRGHCTVQPPCTCARWTCPPPEASDALDGDRGAHAHAHAHPRTEATEERGSTHIRHRLLRSPPASQCPTCSPAMLFGLGTPGSSFCPCSLSERML